MRIVTTLPSATEIVCALGLEPVGVSHECDYPPEVRDLPSITTSRVDATASSAEIDRQVLEATGDGGVYDVDTETLAALDPDLILTQGMCDVCAVDEISIERAVSQIEADPVVVTSDPHAVDDVFGDLERVGRATDTEDRAQAVIAGLEARIDEVRARAAVRASRPRVAVFDWTDPVMIAGHWTADLVEWVGGEYGLAEPGERSRPREWDEILEYDPEVIVAAPCGFGLERTADNFADLAERDGWRDLTAVREGRVWAMDGHHYLNRPGPRLVDTLEHLAPIVRPELFNEPPAAVAVPLVTLERRADA